MANDMQQLLVLDLDETLVFASESPLARPADFMANQYHVYRRPHLEAFLESVSKHFRLAVWSSANDAYVERIVKGVFPSDIPLEFVWGRSRATLRRASTEEGFPAEAGSHLNYRKPLSKLKKLGWRLENILILDDTPAKSAQNYGNAIYPTVWNGDEEDVELQLLARYLPTLSCVENVRTVEKRNWRSKALQMI